MNNFRKGMRVVILDYPFGRKTNIKGQIVGVLPNDHYNIMIEGGLNAGRILKYKFWKLQQISE